MRCSEAREVIQTLMDGLDNARAASAEAHVAGCAECREWRRTLDATLAAVQAAGDDTPEIDIAAAVMAKLPARHPASARTRHSAVRALAWLAACWVIGLAATVVVLGALTAAGAHSWIALPLRLIAGTAKPVAALGVAASAATSTISAVATCVSGAIAQHYAPILTFVAVDVVVLASAVAIWRRRMALVSHIHVLA